MHLDGNHSSDILQMILKHRYVKRGFKTSISHYFICQHVKHLRYQLSESCKLAAKAPDYPMKKYKCLKIRGIILWTSQYLSVNYQRRGNQGTCEKEGKATQCSTYSTKEKLCNITIWRQNSEDACEVPTTQTSLRCLHISINSSVSDPGYTFLIRSLPTPQ